MGLPSADYFSKAQYLTAPTTLAITGTTAKTAALGRGLWIVCANVPWHFFQGAAADVASTTSHLPLAAYEKIHVWIDDNTAAAAVAGIIISGGSSGTVFCQRVD